MGCVYVWVTWKLLGCVYSSIVKEINYLYKLTSCLPPVELKIKVGGKENQLSVRLRARINCCFRSRM